MPSSRKLILDRYEAGNAVTGPWELHPIGVSLYVHGQPEFFQPFTSR